MFITGYFDDVLSNLYFKPGKTLEAEKVDLKVYPRMEPSALIMNS